MAKTIELTEEQLETRIAAGVRAALAAQQTPQMAQPLSEDAKLAQLVAELKGKNRPCPREKLVLCKSEQTGATFKLRVVESRANPNGRIVELIDYAYPAGVDKHVVDGGLVPDRMQMKRPDNGFETPFYKQWRWENFWRRDLQAYVGQSFATRYRIDPNAADEAWTTPQPAKDAAE